ncbi:MAG: PKD domain-containing protein, partial [Candidatus Hydrogenedentes bacterium]|nr:PKD domain-containing protein [Candidatus Hydrogenedentota bacterium]
MKSDTRRGDFVFALLAVLCFTAGSWAQDTTLTLTRDVPAEFYTPGATLDIQVTFAASGAQPVTALGLYETLPVDWTFDSIVGGDVPQVNSSSDNLVEFGWFMIPSFPATFTYRVQVPVGQAGAKQLSGYSEYRTGGGALYTATVITEIPEPPPVPEASFTAAPTTGCIPLDVQFTDTSTGNPTAWEWDFGDGGSSSEQNPLYTYNTPGVYTVSLTVSNASGPDTAVQENLIVVLGVPAGSFEAIPTSGCAELEVAFSDTSTGSPDSYSWDFGDGATSTDASPSHVYMAPGTYSVTLTVQNNCGQDTVVETDLIVVTGPPTASFDAAPTSGDAPLLVQFTDTSAGGPTSLSWDFGDGGAGTSSSPTHTFASAGNYTVTLTASNDCGADDASTIINVKPVNHPPVLDPVGHQSVDEGQVLSVPLSATDPDGDAVAFSVAGSPAFCTLTDNGDGTATLDLSPDHTCAGTYPSVVITAADDGTPVKTDSETITITVDNVNRPPVANAGGDFSVQVATTATLDGSLSSDPDGELITYEWTFDSFPPGSS